MSRQWPSGIPFHKIVLENDVKRCALCDSNMHVCDHRYRKLYSLEQPVQLVCKLVHCSNSSCTNSKQTLSPLSEGSWALPGWKITWDVLAWIGFRRFTRHWSIPQIQEDLKDDYQIILSADAIEDYLRKYQSIVAARQSDFTQLREAYKGCPDVILTVDGLQPEKGHETLYVVRELRKERIWFAEALVSSSNEEITRLIRQAKEWAEAIGVSVKAWVSDKQKAFLTAVSSIFPGVPHRYCKNHFLHDVAAEVLEIDSHAKVQLRRKVRGLRGIEKETIKALHSNDREAGNKLVNVRRSTISYQIITEYCSMVRGILNDNEGGPLNPAGLKMANALKVVVASINRNLAVKDSGHTAQQLKRLRGCIERGLEIYEKERSKILRYLRDLRSINATLQVSYAPSKSRLKSFKRIHERLERDDDPIRVNMSKAMQNFEKGLFAGGDDLDIPDDNLDLERWFKTPKGHERRINGHKHTGTRIVYDGPTLLPTLDVHRIMQKPFETADLFPYREALAPECQIKAFDRRRIMKKGASKKKDPKLSKP